MYVLLPIAGETPQKQEHEQEEDQERLKEWLAHRRNLRLAEEDTQSENSFVGEDCEIPVRTYASID